MHTKKRKINDSSGFEQLSLGNLGDYNSTTMASENKIISNLYSDWTYRETNRYIAYTDFVCIFILLLFIIRFQSTLTKKEKEYDDMTNTALSN